VSGNLLIGTVLVAVALIDAVVGFTVIVPRVEEPRRGVLRLAIGGGALAVFLVGTAFLMGWIGGTA
jgi:hypothetical protein